MSLSWPIGITIYACIAGMFYIGIFPGGLLKVVAEAVQVMR
jgi:hypothetical protein